MKAKLFIGLMILLVGSTAAITIPDSDQLQEFKTTYNNQSDEVPGFVGNIVGGEKVDFRLEANTSNETLGVEFDGVEIEKINDSGFENATLKVWTDEETVNTVIESDEKFSTLREKLNENEIDYEATTVGAKVKVTIFDTLRGLADLVGLEI